MSPVFYYLTLVQNTKHPVLHSLNHLFDLVKFLPQLLYFVAVGNNGQATFRYFHRNTHPDIKSRFLTGTTNDSENARCYGWQAQNRTSGNPG